MPDRRTRPRPLPTPAARIRARPDVAVVDDVFALRDPVLTPDQAATEDLLFVARVIEAAGVPLLRVRDGRQGRILAVDQRHRLVVQRALVAAAAAEPFTARPLDASRVPAGEAVLLADGELAPRDVDLVRLARPRVDPAGRLEQDRGGVQLEFWTREAAEVRLPAPNSLARRRLPAGAEVPAVARLEDREWPTLAGMWDPQVDDVAFAVDVAVPWSGPAERPGPLKHVLRSVHAHLPWARTVWVLAAAPVPAWLRDGDRLRVVAEAGAASRTAPLDRMAGASEHLVQLGEDVLVGRPLPADAFFSPGGIGRYVLGPPTGAARAPEDLRAVEREHRVLAERFGRAAVDTLELAASPVSRGVLTALERELGDDGPVSSSLYQRAALLTGRSLAADALVAAAAPTTTRDGLRSLKQLEQRRDADLVRIDRGGVPEVPFAERQRRTLAVLERWFPAPAPWEDARG